MFAYRQHVLLKMKALIHISRPSLHLRITRDRLTEPMPRRLDVTHLFCASCMGVWKGSFKNSMNGNVSLISFDLAFFLVYLNFLKSFFAFVYLMSLHPGM